MDEELAGVPSASSSSSESLPPINITLDFDPVEFQAAALRTIIKYGCCSGAYAQWVSLSDELKDKLLIRLDKNILQVQEQVRATSWLTLSAHDMEDFREGARMKLLIGAYDEFNSQNNEAVDEREWSPEHLLRIDLKIATFRLAHAMTTLTEWAKVTSKRRTPVGRPFQRQSVVTFTYSTSSALRLKSTFQSLDLLSQAQQPTARTKKSRKSRLDENCNRAAGSPPLSLYSSTIWDLKKPAAGSKPKQGRVEKRSQVESSESSELSLGEYISLESPWGSPLCPSDQSFVSVGEEVKDDPRGQEYQIYTMGLRGKNEKSNRLDFNENASEERMKKTRKRSESRKRTREEAGHASSGREGSGSGGSWITIGSSSSSGPEESVGEDVVDRGHPQSDFFNGHMDPLEMGEYLRHYKSQVRAGSRSIYVIFFGAIFATLGIAGIIATIIVLIRIYVY